MGETKILGKVCEAATGGAVYEDVGSDTVKIAIPTVGPRHWADTGLVDGDTEADRALRRGIALHNLDRHMVRPMLNGVADKRARSKRRRQFRHAQKVYAKGGKLPRDFGWWSLICIGLLLIFSAALGLGLALIWQGLQSGASVC